MLSQKHVTNAKTVWQTTQIICVLVAERTKTTLIKNVLTIKASCGTVHKIGQLKGKMLI